MKLSWNGASVFMDCLAGLGVGYRRGKHLAVPRTWKRYGTLHHRLDITISHGLAPASRLAGMPVSIQRLGAASGVAPLQTIERPFGTGHHPRPFANLHVEAVRHVRAVRLKDGIDGIHQLPHQRCLLPIEKNFTDRHTSITAKIRIVKNEMYGLIKMVVLNACREIMVHPGFHLILQILEFPQISEQLHSHFRIFQARHLNISYPVTRRL
ncbi:hypothetical protein IAE26_03815 [Delftia sp. S67]|nr:hypothetical protein [Delftia sp. S65]MBK0116971.1 hypothetical protein [Delftia sp. S67]